ncbi:MAG: hypothetical protein MRY32_00625 [Rickettsiales bacterium]|nr:hypothetical protein [Rickettsiales bacterium]
MPPPDDQLPQDGDKRGAQSDLESHALEEQYDPEFGYVQENPFTKFSMPEGFEHKIPPEGFPDMRPKDGFAYEEASLRDGVSPQFGASKGFVLKV